MPSYNFTTMSLTELKNFVWNRLSPGQAIAKNYGWYFAYTTYIEHCNFGPASESLVRTIMLDRLSFNPYDLDLCIGFETLGDYGERQLFGAHIYTSSGTKVRMGTTQRTNLLTDNTTDWTFAHYDSEQSFTNNKSLIVEAAQKMVQIADVNTIFINVRAWNNKSLIGEITKQLYVDNTRRCTGWWPCIHVQNKSADVFEIYRMTIMDAPLNVVDDQIVGGSNLDLINAF